MDTCVLVQGRAGLHDDGGEEVKHEVGEAVQPTLLNTDQTGYRILVTEIFGGVRKVAAAAAQCLLKIFQWKIHSFLLPEDVNITETISQTHGGLLTHCRGWVLLLWRCTM